jgi:hypothetical protein
MQDSNPRSPIRNSEDSQYSYMLQMSTSHTTQVAYSLGIETVPQSKEMKIVPGKKVKVKISLLQAVEAPRIARG